MSAWSQVNSVVTTTWKGVYSRGRCDKSLVCLLLLLVASCSFKNLESGEADFRITSLHLEVTFWEVLCHEIRARDTLIFLDVFKNNTSKLKLLIYFNISLESALKLTSGFLREQKQSAGEEERNPSHRKTTLSFNIVNVKESTPVENWDTEKSIRKIDHGC